MTADASQVDVVMIHGFKSSAKALYPWKDFIPNVGFFHLPGHGGAEEVGEVSVKAWIAALRHLVERLDKPPLIIAESLGAVVAINLPARALVAIEPVLTTDKLWPVHRRIRKAQSLGWDIGPDYIALFDQSYEWVLDKISVPTLVIAGQDPLLPEREVSPEPSLLTDEDYDRYATHPLVTALRIPGGHTLLDHNRDGVLAAIRPFMAANPPT